MTSLREAVDYFEQEWQLDGRPYLWDARRAIDSRPVMRDAAHTLLSILDASEEVAWCEVHGAQLDDNVVDEGRCWRYETDDVNDPCRIVSVRLFPSSLLAGLGET